MLPALHGDSILVSYGTATRPHHILIDCGTAEVWPALEARLASVPRLELVVLTHIDEDHVEGAIPFLQNRRPDLEIGDVWFNGWPQIDRFRWSRAKAARSKQRRGLLGAKQGEMVSTLLHDQKLPWNEHQLWDGGPVHVPETGDLPTAELPGGMKLTILSPWPLQLAKLRKTWNEDIRKHKLKPGQHAQFRQFLAGTPVTETRASALVDESKYKFRNDGSRPNASSIAFLAEYKGRRALLSGDAVVPVLKRSITRLLEKDGGERLRLDAFKVPHHGSRNNLNLSLLSMLDCSHYLVSCNGAVHKLPDNEAIGRIIHAGGTNPQLVFNYDCDRTEVWGTAKAARGNPEFGVHYGDGAITVELHGRTKGAKVLEPEPAAG